MRRTHLLLSAAFLLFTSFTTAMEVSKVKGNRVLIQLDDQPVSPGDEFYAMNPDGKRKGLIKIKQVRDERAIGLLAKGQAEPGWTLEKRTKNGSKTKPKESTNSTASDTTGNPNDRAYYGLQLGMSMNQMSVSQSNGDTVSLTGTSINFRGLFDYELFDRIWFRGNVGYMGFKTTGPNRCGNSFNAACTVDISYIDLDFWGRYLFSMGMYRPWLGGGFSLVFPMSKTATPLDPASISNNTIIALGGGLDWFFTKRFYVPLQAEYGLLPKSSTVSASIIVLRLGAAFTF